MSKDGFDNEKEIASYLDSKNFSQLNNNMRRFLKFLNGSNLKENSLIRAKAINGQFKTDLVIKFNNKTKNISVKKGSGNSFHQEKIETFIEFIDKLGASKEVKIYLVEFIDSYKDGKVYFSEFPSKKEAIQKFFDKHSKKLLIRFIRTGKYKEYPADYIYHGKISHGKFGKTEFVINKMIKERPTGNAQIYVGALTFQKWNTRNESKRGSIQLKGPTINKFLK